MKKDEATAARRRVPLHITVDGVAGWDGTVTGIKGSVSKNGAAAAATTADIVKLAAGVVYVELSAANLDTAGLLRVSVLADTGRALASTIVLVTVDDPTVAATESGHTLAEIADAVNPTHAT